MTSLHGHEPKASEPASAKTLSTYQARFALLGYELRNGSRDAYEVSCWNQFRVCRSIADLHGFLTQLGGAT